MSDKKKEYRAGILDGVPIGLGYLAVSFTFGIMAADAGLTVLQATILSLTNLTSAGQFAGLGVIQAGASFAEMALTELIINLRYCLMSCSLSQLHAWISSISSLASMGLLTVHRLHSRQTAHTRLAPVFHANSSRRKGTPFGEWAG